MTSLKKIEQHTKEAALFRRIRPHLKEEITDHLIWQVTYTLDFTNCTCYEPTPSEPTSPLSKEELIALDERVCMPCFIKLCKIFGLSFPEKSPKKKLVKVLHDIKWWKSLLKILCWRNLV